MAHQMEDSQDFAFQMSGQPFMMGQQQGFGLQMPRLGAGLNNSGFQPMAFSTVANFGAQPLGVDTAGMQTAGSFVGFPNQQFVFYPEFEMNENLRDYAGSEDKSWDSEIKTRDATIAKKKKTKAVKKPVCGCF